MSPGGGGVFLNGYHCSVIHLVVQSRRHVFSPTEPDGQVEEVQVGQLAVETLQLEVEVADLLAWQLQVDGRLDGPAASWQIICYHICNKEPAIVFTTVRTLLLSDLAPLLLLITFS